MISTGEVSVPWSSSAKASSSPSSSAPNGIATANSSLPSRAQSAFAKRPSVEQFGMEVACLQQMGSAIGGDPLPHGRPDLLVPLPGEQDEGDVEEQRGDGEPVDLHARLEESAKRCAGGLARG